MENASRALIMAAGVLIAIVIVSAFILMMSNLTNYQQSSYQSNLSAQIAEFNSQYTNYARNGVRGSEMISLMNRVVDYNTRYAGAQDYTEMQITIDMNGYNDDLAYDGTNRLVKRTEYTQDNISEIVGQPSSISSDISSGTIRNIESKYQQKYANQIQAQISTIASILNDKTLNTTEKQNAAFDEEGWLPRAASTYGNVSQIYKDALVYYEYILFKRTNFNCIGEPEYDSNTGRIIKMEFECTGIGV